MRRILLVLFVLGLATLGLWWALDSDGASRSTLQPESPSSVKSSPSENPELRAATLPAEEPRTEPGEQATRTVASMAVRDTRATLSLRLVDGGTKRAYPTAGLNFRSLSGDEAFATTILAENNPVQDGQVRTNLRGQVSVVIPAGVDFEIRAYPNHPAYEQEIVKVPALQPDELRKGTLSLHPNAKRKVRLKVIALEDNRPLPGARVQLSERPRSTRLWLDHSDKTNFGTDLSLHELETDAEGECEVELRTFRLHLIEVGAEGRSSYAATLDPGRRNQPTIALALATTLSGRVLDQDGDPVADIGIRIGSNFRTVAHEEWIAPPPLIYSAHGKLTPHPLPASPPANATARTTESGEFEFKSLPIGVSLTVAFFRGGKRVHLLDRPLQLDSGHQTREWVLIEGGDLRGRIQDQRGVPVAGARITLERPNLETIQANQLQGHFQLSAAISDARGRFTLERIPAGSWLLRLATTQPGKVGNHVVADPIFVEHPHEDAGEHVLLAHRNLFVQGRVLSLEGKPLSNIQVTISGNGVTLHSKTHGKVGVFRLGPLSAGEYEISASHKQLGATQLRRVVAGETDLDLQLRSPRTIRGTVVSAPSETRMRVELIPHDTREAPRVAWTENKGLFRRVPVEPGVWNVYAHAEGWFALQRDVRVPRSDEVVTLEMTALRGAEIFLAVRGIGKRFRYSIEQDGATLVLNQAIASGERERLTVPFGSITVLLSDEFGTVAERQRLTTAPGDRREVVFKMGR